eukprot:2429195-Amphidinium_carterae.3
MMSTWSTKPILELIGHYRSALAIGDHHLGLATSRMQSCLRGVQPYRLTASTTARGTTYWLSLKRYHSCTCGASAQRDASHCHP